MSGCHRVQVSLQLLQRPVTSGWVHRWVAGPFAGHPTLADKEDWAPISDQEVLPGARPQCWVLGPFRAGAFESQLQRPSRSG